MPKLSNTQILKELNIHILHGGNTIMETRNLKELRSLRAEQEAKADELLEEGKLEEGKDALEQIKELDARIAEVEEEIKAIKEEGTKKEDDTKKEDAPVAQKEGEQRSMTSNNYIPAVAQKEESAEVRGFMEFLRSKGEVREGVKSDGVDVIIPKDIVTEPVQLPETVTNLKDYANVVKVNTAQGSYPILESPDTVMISVEELAKNPELQHPQFKAVDYKVLTYRGQVPVSEEALQDSTPDLGKLVADHNARIALNTSNKLIADQMKKFTAVDVAGTDEIKTVINTQIDPAYNLTLVASQSFFNKLDLLKDKNGQYILQNDITSPSGRSIFGIKVEVISDKLLGAQGEANAFLGDVSQAIMFADRAEASVRWVQNDIYGQILAISQRMDAVVANEEAGFFLTFKGDTPSTEA